MPLTECHPFADVAPGFPDDDASLALQHALVGTSGLERPVSIGFPRRRPLAGDVEEVDRVVDAFFSLRDLGFEDRASTLTVGVRASRFALIVFWEAFHLLRPGGLWIDVDETERMGKSLIGAPDVLERRYFAHALDKIAQERVGRVTATLYRKVRPSLVSSGLGDPGWTFGILTSGPSPHACRMVEEIRSLALPGYEILLCGPEPGPLPDDPRVRRIDLDRPEPRGWITRKKNLIAEQARHENLCLLHDRFRLPPNFVEAVTKLGPSRHHHISAALLPRAVSQHLLPERRLPGHEAIVFSAGRGTRNAW